MKTVTNSKTRNLVTYLVVAVICLVAYAVTRNLGEKTAEMQINHTESVINECDEILNMVH